MKVIAISGHAQNGKDTVAGMIEEMLVENGERVLITHYGDLVKYVCKTFFGWDGKKDLYGRHLLQYVGTDVVRAEEPDFWVDFIIAMLRFFGDGWDYVIIPDARFQNEVEKLRESGFDIDHIRVVRPNYDSGLTEEQKKHASETALDGVRASCVFLNNGTLDDLRILVGHYVKETVYGEHD